jgi:hypothetical protein
MKRAIGLVIMCLSLAALSFGSGFSLRFGGGATTLSGGDYNSIVQGRNDYYHALSDYTLTGELNKLEFSADFDAELVYDLNDYLGFGLGVGYLHVSNDGQIIAATTGGGVVEAFTPLLTSLYAAASLQANLPVGETIRLHLSAGPAIYATSFKFDYTFGQDPEGTDESLSFDSERKMAVGFQGAFGIEVGLSDTVFGFIHLVGRAVSYSGISGSYDITGVEAGHLVDATGTGSWWYHETDRGGVYYPDWTLSQNMPTGADIRNVRAAEMSLSGVGVRLGLKIGL